MNDWPKMLDLGGVLVPITEVQRVAVSAQEAIDEAAREWIITEIELTTKGGPHYYKVSGAAAARLWAMFSANTVFGVDWVEEADQEDDATRSNPPAPVTTTTYAHGIGSCLRLVCTNGGWGE